MLGDAAGGVPGRFSVDLTSRDGGERWALQSVPVLAPQGEGAQAEADAVADLPVVFVDPAAAASR